MPIMLTAFPLWTVIEFFSDYVTSCIFIAVFSFLLSSFRLSPVGSHKPNVSAARNRSKERSRFSYVIFFQARQILDVEFERLINEGTHRQLGIPSDGRNSASSMGSLGDRSISPVS